jgi:hypothetical protein
MEKLTGSTAGQIAEALPPERVVNFVRRVIRGEKFYGGPERRVHLRYPITIPVRATPLNDAEEPVGEPFLGITRDISIEGLCMYHMQSVKEKLLQLELTSPNREQISVLLEVVRCKAVGPFFEIAGRFKSEA